MIHTSSVGDINTTVVAEYNKSLDRSQSQYSRVLPGASNLHKSMMLSALTVVLTTVSAVLAQQLPGACPEHPPMPSFNATRFAGIWFDSAHTKRGTGLELTCDQIKFTATLPSKLTFNSLSLSSTTKNVITASGEAEVLSNSGKLRVNIPSLSKTSEVRLLATDYTTYAVLWACHAKDNKHSERSLILTRDKHPSSEVVKNAKKVLENNNISKSDLNESTQHKCPEYNFNTNSESVSLSHATSMGALLTPRA